MKLVFRRFLETGEMPPFVFQITRDEIFRLLGTPSSWASKDEGIGPPQRDYFSSDSISYGSLTFSLESDRLIGISLAPDIMHDREWSYPVTVISFPQRDTMLTEVADYMRRHETPFEDISEKGDGSILRSGGGVTLVSWPGSYGRLSFCCSEERKKKTPNQALLPTPTSVTDRADARSAPAAGAADL